MKKNMTRKNMPEPVPSLRCAIYTRKSTTEGLDSDFSSLDAQREACEAYIRSQLHEGWVALPDFYDDGGYTGGNTDRPAFQRLLADIEADKIDCVIVYKVDRLSRSLMDFARIMEVFEKHNVSFVSITQQFNTATSMGRLMLNVLLSFAQFEREIISERTRDKIAAARKKGKWVGGYPILGYDLDRDAHRLVINEAEAAQVREIFKLYLKNQSLMPTVEVLNERGWTTKTWTTIKGNVNGGKPFDKSRLHRLLTNVAYLGKVRHNENIYDGEHSAIIDQPTWERVQGLLRLNAKTGGARVRNKYGALLKGVVRCAACDCAMVHTYSVKKDKRYRYYVCLNAQKRGWQACPTKSISASDLEDFVVERIRDIGKDPNLAEATICRVADTVNDKKPRLLNEQRRLQLDIPRLNEETKRIVNALGSGNGNTATIITERLTEIETSIEAKNRRLTEIKDELLKIERDAVDRDDIKKALSLFDPIWDVLYPKERARIISLLIQQIDYNGKDGTIAITFHPTGIKTLADEVVG